MRFRTHRRRAERKGWIVPQDNVFPPEAWLNYWQQCEACENDPSLGRPVPPHRSGGGRLYPSKAEP